MIISRTTDQFWRGFEKLPKAVQDQARSAYKQFRDDPYHDSLRFKKLIGRNNAYLIRAGLHYRALGLLKQNTIYWFWIGTHAEYDRITQS